MIYLDNAATSFPKPAEYFNSALKRYLKIGASPGRGGYDLAVEAETAVAAVRRKLISFFGGDENYQLYFSSNATDAINTLLQGVLKPGDHVVSSRLEHNSVLRPLHHLCRQKQVHFDLVPFTMDGFIEPEQISAAITPKTKLVVLTHASNVIGTIQPVEEIAKICHSYNVPLILDVSQSAGVIPIQIKAWGVSGLVFTGHKSLLGPTGIGGLLLKAEVKPEPCRYGGTGVDSQNLYHTLDYPHRLEAGTINVMAIFMLEASLDFVSQSYTSFYTYEMELLERLKGGLLEIPKIRLFCADCLERHIPVLNCTLKDHKAVDVGAILDGDFGIAVRSGLHCAPLVHQDLGTMPDGTVRFSLGPFNTKDHIEKAIEAIKEIAEAI